MYTRIFAALLISTLTACGGGGGGSSDAPTPEANTPATTTPPPAATPTPAMEVEVATVKEVTSTAELETSADFTLGSNRTLAIDVDITGLGNNNGYLSICALQGSSKPNYKNCMVRVAIDQSRYQGSVMLSTAVDRVASAIWFLDLSLEPLIQVHEVSAGRLVVSH